jgi:hypothetical protein
MAERLGDLTRERDGELRELRRKLEVALSQIARRHPVARSG